MLFSRGTPVWSDLSACFVNIDLLLIFLKRKMFNGYVKLESKKALFLILIDEGDVVAGVEKNISTEKSFIKSVNEIIAAAREDATMGITVSKLLKDTVEVFSKLYNENCRIVRKNLHSDFAKIGKMFAQMQKDKFNGYILVDFIKEESHGMIMLSKGRTKAVITDNIQLNSDDSESAKMKSAARLLSKAQKKEAVFNVFQLL